MYSPTETRCMHVFMGTPPKKTTKPTSWSECAIIKVQVVIWDAEINDQIMCIT